jgi:hypothetical protein
MTDNTTPPFPALKYWLFFSWIALYRPTKHTLSQTQRLDVEVQGSTLPLSTLNVTGWRLGLPGLGVVWISSAPAGLVLLLCLILRYDRLPSGDIVAASKETGLKTGRQGLRFIQIRELFFCFCLQTTVRCAVHTGGSFLGPGHEITIDLCQMTSSTSNVPIHIRGRTDSTTRFYFHRFLSRFVT